MDCPPKYHPNHLGLRCTALPRHLMALITSGSVPFSAIGSPRAGETHATLPKKATVAIGATVIPLHPHLPLVGISIVIERGRQ